MFLPYYSVTNSCTCYLKNWICRQDFQSCKQIDYWQFLSAFWWHSPVRIAPTPHYTIARDIRKTKISVPGKNSQVERCFNVYFACMVFLYYQKTDTFVTKERLDFVEFSNLIIIHTSQYFIHKTMKYIHNWNKDYYDKKKSKIKTRKQKYKLTCTALS